MDLVDDFLLQLYCFKSMPLAENNRAEKYIISRSIQKKANATDKTGEITAFFLRCSTMLQDGLETQTQTRSMCVCVREREVWYCRVRLLRNGTDPHEYTGLTLVPSFPMQTRYSRPFSLLSLKRDDCRPGYSPGEDACASSFIDSKACHWPETKMLRAASSQGRPPKHQRSPVIKKKRQKSSSFANSV